MHFFHLHYIIYPNKATGTHTLNDWMHNNQLQEIVQCPQSHVLSQTNNWLKQALIFFPNCNQTNHLVTLSLIAITISLPHIKVLICWMLGFSNRKCGNIVSVGCQLKLNGMLFDTLTKTLDWCGNGCFRGALGPGCGWLEWCFDWFANMWLWDRVHTLQGTHYVTDLAGWHTCQNLSRAALHELFRMNCSRPVRYLWGR